MNNIDWRKYWEYVKESSMLNWWPKIKDLDMPKPKTEIIEITADEMGELVGFEKLKARTYTKIVNCAVKIGFPLFMRTDQYSAKHSYKNTCYVSDISELFGHIHMLLEEAMDVNMVGLPTRALVFREFIELNYGFKAFYGLPIARERRYLIRDGKVIGHFPYWVESAIRFWGKEKEEPKNWRIILRELNNETEEEINLLVGYAEKVAKVVKGFWSVDFAQSKDGVWYLIDMAKGEVSYIPEEIIKRYNLPRC